MAYVMKLSPFGGGHAVCVVSKTPPGKTNLQGQMTRAPCRDVGGDTQRLSADYQRFSGTSPRLSPNSFLLVIPPSLSLQGNVRSWEESSLRELSRSFADKKSCFPAWRTKCRRVMVKDTGGTDSRRMHERTITRNAPRHCVT